MSKKVYHIPLQQALTFIKVNKSTLLKLTTEPKYLEYSKLLGKSYYTLEIEIFINFFKIDKSLSYALSTMEYFNSVNFLDEAYKLLNFSQFNLEEKQIHKKRFFLCLLSTFFSTKSRSIYTVYTKTIFTLSHNL